MPNLSICDWQPWPTFADAGPDFCTLHWWCFPSINCRKSSTCTHGGQHLLQLALMLFFLPSAGANTPLAHVVVSTCCNLHWCCFSFHQLVQILHLHTWWSSPAATCAGVFFPATGTNTPSSLVWGGIPSDVSWFEACCARQEHRCQSQLYMSRKKPRSCKKGYNGAIMFWQESYIGQYIYIYM